jgi:hypothetical protein
MYVFVTWSSVSTAKAQEARREEWVSSLPTKTKEQKVLAEKLTTEFCLPEYHHLQQALAANDDLDGQVPLDALNKDMLSIRIFHPAADRSGTYQLHRRLPPEVKQPVNVAARAFLLKNFPGEWTANSSCGRVTLVGFEGLRLFLRDWAFGCAALGSPLPPTLWMSPHVVEFPENQVRTLVESLAQNAGTSKDRSLFQESVLGWMGPGASALRDSDVLNMASSMLGLTVQQEK